MELQGHIHNGVVVLDGHPELPEGAAVTVSLCESPASSAESRKTRVEFPLVRSDNPGSVHLTNEMIAQIFEEEDLAAFLGKRDVSP